MLRSEATDSACSPRFEFLKGFLRRPSLVGSVTPSSRFLEKAIVSQAGLSALRSVVELGPGTGGTTRAMLRAMPRRATLLAIEFDPLFAEIVASADDPRLIVQQGSAEDLATLVERHRLAPPEAVVSGIPFSSMTPEMGQRILRSIREVLAPGGVFVAYQLRSTVAELAMPAFGSPERRWEVRNLPPLRIFRWRVPGGGVREQSHTS